MPLRVELGGRMYRDVTLVEGPVGWGECSPLPSYPALLSQCRAAAREAATRGWPPARRSWVAVNGVVPAVSPDEAAAMAEAWVREQESEDAPTVKIKVGDAHDVDRVAAVRAAVGPRPRLRIDANGAWSLDEAVERIGRLAVHDLELVEQPVTRLEDLAGVRRRTGVPIAADECVRGVEDARRLHRLEAADAVVLKVQPLGGVRAALEVAEAAGIAAIVSSMFETSVGLAAGLALAAALPELPYACGLGSASLLAADVVSEPLLAVRGRLEVRNPRPEPELLAGLERDGRG